MAKLSTNFLYRVRNCLRPHQNLKEREHAYLGLAVFLGLAADSRIPLMKENQSDFVQVPVQGKHLSKPAT